MNACGKEHALQFARKALLYSKLCQILSSGPFSVINISLDSNTDFRVKDCDSGEYNRNVNHVLTRIHNEEVFIRLFYF